jgi:glutathione S-transferase
MALKLIGNGLSPFVRKARVALAEKGLAYEHDPMIPFGVPEEYKLRHPLGKIPTLLDGDRVIPDSSAILAYLEGTTPTPALYPQDPYERARAIWLEEFADGGLVAKGLAVPFQQNVINAIFFKQEPDEALIREAVEVSLPPLFDYLERELGDAEWLVGGRFSVADVAMGSVFVNFGHGGGEVDGDRWPRLAAYLARVHARPSFKGLIEEDQQALAQARG